MSTDSPWERLARRFHEVYEELAPKFEWETQSRSRVPWTALPASQKRLMIETVATVVPEYLRSETAPTQIGHESTQDGHGDKSETPRTDAYEKEVPVVGTLDQAHRAWGELCRMLERELNAARSATGDTALLDFMEGYIIEGTDPRTGKVAWLADAECIRDTIETAIEDVKRKRGATDSGRDK